MKLGYTAKEVCKVANITYRQLSYWDKTNLVKPSIAGARGTGSRRIYSFVDLVSLRVTSRLKGEGMSLQKIRRSVGYLSKHFPEFNRPLADVVFLTDGVSIFVLTEDPRILLDTLHDGQFVLSLAVGKLAEDTKARILSMERQEEAEGHVFEVVIEPDRDVYLEIYVMNADASRQRRLTNSSARDLVPSWSPDGKKIAFASNRDGNKEIYVMNADGTEQKRLTNRPALDSGPSWSPDGEKIAFHSDRDGNGEIYIMNADGSNQERLTNNPADDGGPCWSPDGKKIAFASIRDGNGEIYIMNADGSNQERLTNNPAVDSSPSWSPFLPSEN